MIEAGKFYLVGFFMLDNSHSFLHAIRLQKFKLHMANSIITQENSALQTMGTEQLVDLFSVESASNPSSSSSTVRSPTQKPPVKGLESGPRKSRGFMGLLAV